MCKIVWYNLRGLKQQFISDIVIDNLSDSELPYVLLCILPNYFHLHLTI